MSRNTGETLRQMQRRKRRNHILIVCGTLILVFLLLVSLYWYNLHSRDYVPPLIDDSAKIDSISAVVHFIDVGQADAACIVLGSGETVLIDAGSNASEDKLLSYLSGYGVRRIDYAVFTHPHEDHIGGADAVFDAYDIMNVILPDAVAATSTYEIMLEKIKKEGCSITSASVGDTFNVGDATLTILGPTDGFDESNLNNASIILRFDFGNTSFLFTGDAETLAEQTALQYGTEHFNADVIKVGHHGSSTSSCEEFLSAVTPDVAVISCGSQNEYGHPHQVIVDRLRTYTEHIYRTDISGSVRISTNGEALLVKCDHGISNIP